MREVDKAEIRRWRKRGFYSENALVKLLQKNGYHAVRVPVSNPSLNPLPDVMARSGFLREMDWKEWEKEKLPDKARILKRDHGNLTL
jgi:Holliday junction resolvase